MRAFLAFEASAEVVEALLSVENELSGTGADVKLVEKDNLHFTVKFLGEIPESLVLKIDERVRVLVLERMDIDVRGLGAFPDARRPRVVWAGLAAEDEPKVSKASGKIIDALEGVGESDPRPFHPHITVARVRSQRNIEALTAAIRANSKKEFGKSSITALKLKSSTLTPNGPIYRDVREYPLQ
jgi:RNA 2',3'-cyclic 3'-phosphodiesterase